MPSKPEPDLGINSWLEAELYEQYLRDRSAVDESWKHLFEEADAAPGVAAAATAPAATSPHATLPHSFQPLRGAAGRIAENMAASLSIPLATSQRTIAVKVMDENRRIINQHRVLLASGKVSYTHLIGWAVVKADRKSTRLNSSHLVISY